jgi:hypothetical protein
MSDDPAFGQFRKAHVLVLPVNKWDKVCKPCDKKGRSRSVTKTRVSIPLAISCRSGCKGSSIGVDETTVSIDRHDPHVFKPTFLLPRCYQDRTNQAHLGPYRRCPVLRFSVVLVGWRVALRQFLNRRSPYDCAHFVLKPTSFHLTQAYPTEIRFFQNPLFSLGPVSLSGLRRVTKTLS